MHLARCLYQTPKASKLPELLETTWSFKSITSFQLCSISAFLMLYYCELTCWLLLRKPSVKATIIFFKYACLGNLLQWSQAPSFLWMICDTKKYLCVMMCYSTKSSQKTKLCLFFSVVLCLDESWEFHKRARKVLLGCKCPPCIHHRMSDQGCCVSIHQKKIKIQKYL